MASTADALTTLSQTVAILAQQSSQFEKLLQSVDNLSIQGRGILETYYPQIVTQLQTLQAVSNQLGQNQADLAGILRCCRLNNNALPSSVRGDFLQLYENIIVCGLPGGGEDDSSPAFTCAPTRGGRRMITPRLIANLVVFFLVSALLVGYGVVTLLGDPFRSPIVLTSDFPDASGLYQNFTVELNGVPVGTVGASTHPNGTRVTMDIHPGTKVPGDVRSSIQIANDLGEQVVDLVPAHGGTAPPLRRGRMCRWRRTRSRPTSVRWSTRPPGCCGPYPAGDLNQLIGDLAASLQGRATDLRTIVSAGTTFSEEFLAYQQQFTQLLANAPAAARTRSPRWRPSSNRTW